VLPGQVIDRRYLLRKYNGSKLLLVADLHLGFDIGLSSRFDNREPRWSYDIIDKLKMDIETTKSEYLIVLGDLEHTFIHEKSTEKGTENRKAIIQERKENLFVYFENQIMNINGLEILIINGEHDSSILEYLGSSVDSYSADGTTLFENQLGVFHGDQKPKELLLLSSEIMIGHVHPTIEFIDELQISHKLPVFAKLTQPREELFKLFGFNIDFDEFLDFSLIDLVPIIILPSYNSYIPGFLLNKPKGIQAKTKAFPELKTIIRNPKLNIRMTDGVEIGFLEGI
jgi:metallophosphoesterase superfamily enzyme